MPGLGCGCGAQILHFQFPSILVRLAEPSMPQRSYPSLLFSLLFHSATNGRFHEIVPIHDFLLTSSLGRRFCFSLGSFIISLQWWFWGRWQTSFAFSFRSILINTHHLLFQSILVFTATFLLLSSHWPLRGI